MIKNTRTPEQFDRRERVMATEGVSILEIAARRLLRRKDWKILIGARYPRNGHWWGRKKNGKPRWIGPVPPNDDKEERAIRG